VRNAVNCGILSTADSNRKVIPGARESPKVNLVAVSSRDNKRAEEYARSWEIERAYGSYDELLADPEIEAVYNPLPNTMHVEWLINALEAGKHVLCEKPMSRNAADVERAFKIAERNGRILSEAFMYRHNPQTRRLKQLVGDGAIGELRLIRAAFSYGLYDAENIRLRTDVEGGALMDVGCYCVSGCTGRRASARRARIGSSRAPCAFPATCSQRSTAARRSSNATSWRRSAARARSS
jgi:predicted dehydrogenase